MIRKLTLLTFAGMTFFCRLAGAQGVQNMDISYLAGPVWTDRQTIPGSNVTLRGSTGHATGIRYGYQVARVPFASLWIEFGQTFAFNRSTSEQINSSGLNNFNGTTIGIRLMTPLHERLAVYGALGGGGGRFYYHTVQGELLPYTSSHSTFHGVFEIGGGVDFRLIRLLSIRGEVRDLITGRGLSGSTGRHHVVPLFGIAFHF